MTTRSHGAHAARLSTPPRVARALRRTLVPACFVATGALLASAFLGRVAPARIMAIAPPVWLAVLTLLELWVGRWRPRVRWLPRDLFCFAAGGGLDALGKIAAAQVALRLWSHGHGPAARLPLALAIPLGLLVVDGVAYAVHRVFHARPLLWRMHALHHSARELYALVSTVNGPLMVLLVRALPVVALAALGFSAEVFFAYALLDALLGLTQHTGVDTHNPWLAALFVTPEVHRLHHSADVAEAGNYGLLLTAWDRALGTWVPPRKDQSAPTPGLAEPHTMPATWVGLLLLRRPAAREP